MTPNSPNIDLLQRGIEAARAKRPAEARQLLLRAVELDERNEQAWLWLSGVVETFDDRRVCLDNVLAINPANQRALAGIRWLDEHAPVSAPVQEHCPHCAAPLPASGETCPACKQPVLVICPHCDEFTEVRATACLHCGHSFGDFKQRTNYYITLAADYANEGKLQPAHWAIDQAIASVPHEAEAWARIAAVRVQLGRPADAIAAYQQALAHDATRPAIYLDLGELYRRQAMPHEASGLWSQALRQFQNQPDCLIELAGPLATRRETSDAAVKMLGRAVHVQPRNVTALMLLGNLYAARNEPDLARDQFKHAVALTEVKSAEGQQARQALARVKSVRTGNDTQRGTGLREAAGPMLISIMAALANARLSPLNLSPIAWLALIGSAVGAYLWTAAGPAGQAHRVRNLIGMGIWLIGFGLIVIRV